MMANGTIILNRSRAPCEKGSNIGIRRETASRLKLETEAMFPVEKNPDCKKNRKNRARRRSGRAKVRKVDSGDTFAGCLDTEVMVTPFGALPDGGVLADVVMAVLCSWITFSSRTHASKVQQNVKKNNPSYEIVKRTNVGEKVRKIITSRWR